MRRLLLLLLAAASVAPAIAAAQDTPRSAATSIGQSGTPVGAADASPSGRAWAGVLADNGTASSQLPRQFAPIEIAPDLNPALTYDANGRFSAPAELQSTARVQARDGRRFDRIGGRFGERAFSRRGETRLAPVTPTAP